MSVKYKYSGLTPELYQRLVSEHATLKQAHPKDYKQYFQDVRQCSEVQARNIYQKFNSVVVGRLKLSPKTAKELEGILMNYSAIFKIISLNTIREGQSLAQK